MSKRELPIAKAISRVFNRLGFTSQDLLTGQIVHTDLPWQCPPLHCEDELDGMPLYEYLDYKVPTNLEALYNFWVRGLDRLWDTPSEAIGGAGWRSTAQALPAMSFGERALRLSTPDGFPDATNPHAGVVFSMEVAHLAFTSASVQSFEMDDDNYCVTLSDGRVMGVVNGVPATPSCWEVSAAGQLSMFAASGRGATVTTCRYDLLAKIRSVLHENAARFAEFEGIDWALQALAKLSANQLCAPLQQAIEGMSIDAFAAARKLRAVEEAIATMDTWIMNDRVKIETLYQTLVPDVLRASQFQRSIFNLYQTIPAVLAPSTEKKIKLFLRNMKAKLERECKPKSDPS